MRQQLHVVVSSLPLGVDDMCWLCACLPLDTSWNYRWSSVPPSTTRHGHDAARHGEARGHVVPCLSGTACRRCRSRTARRPSSHVVPPRWHGRLTCRPCPCQSVGRRRLGDGQGRGGSREKCVATTTQGREQEATAQESQQQRQGSKEAVVQVSLRWQQRGGERGGADGDRGARSTRESRTHDSR